MKINEIVKVFVERFEKEGIDFTLIGAFALLQCGIERATRDIDFLISDDDVSKVKKIMEDLTYEPIQISKSFSQFESPLRALGNVDFMHVSGDIGMKMLKSSKKVKFLDTKLKVVRPEDLIGLKVLAYSNDPEREDKDKADIKSLHDAHIKGKIEIDVEKLKRYYNLFNKQEDYNKLWLKGK